MTKNKNTLKLHDFSSELSAMNISKMSATVDSATQFKSIDDFVILEKSNLEFMNLEISKQKLKSLQKQHKLVEIMIKITEKQ